MWKICLRAQRVRHCGFSGAGRRELAICWCAGDEPDEPEPGVSGVAAWLSHLSGCKSRLVFVCTRCTLRAMGKRGQKTRTDVQGSSKKPRTSSKNPSSSSTSSTSTSSTSSSLTKGQIAEDALTTLAKQHWKNSSTSTFSPSLVSKLYHSELHPPTSSTSSSWKGRAKVLELSQYLEEYLWPNLPTSSPPKEHILSIVIMVNLKSSLSLSPFTPLTSSPPIFESFVTHTLSLTSPDAFTSLSPVERVWLLEFIDVLVRSLSNETVASIILPLVSLPLWTHLPHPTRARSLERLGSSSPHLVKLWGKISKILAKKKGSPATQARIAHASTWLPSLLSTCIDLLSTPQEAAGKGNVAQTALAEKLLSLLSDLLSQLPTRRFFNTYLSGTYLPLRLHAIPLVASTPSLRALLQLVEFYATFQVDDYTGDALTAIQAESRLSDAISAAQAAAALAPEPHLHQLALVNHATFLDSTRLSEVLLAHTDEQIEDIATKLGLVDAALLAILQHPYTSSDLEQPAIPYRDLLLGVLHASFASPPSQLEAINSLPLMPTETDLFDPVYDISYGQNGKRKKRGGVGNADLASPTNALSFTPSSLALPRLNLQFLSIYDYLVRNFHLFRLEANYEIRSDLEDVLSYAAPRKSPEGHTLFTGWAKMGLPLIAPPSVGKIHPPKLGSHAPRKVTISIPISIAGLSPDLAYEWDNLRRGEAVFLLAVNTTLDLYAGGEPRVQNVSVKDVHGLSMIRGGQVVAIYDDAGDLLPAFDRFGTHKTARNKSHNKTRKQKEEVDPHGRRLVLDLDAAQFAKDVAAFGTETRAREAYGTLNFVMRRNPKENNFRAVLHTMRALMNASSSVPPWLHEIFLGFGSPDSAHYGALLATPEGAAMAGEGGHPGGWLDFVDTFVDADHAESALGGLGLSVSWESGTRVPSPPYMVRFDPEASAAVLKAGPTRRVHAFDAERGSKVNKIRFTPRQVEGIRGGLAPGLNMVVGPPGTGKTDVAVQIVNALYHNFPNQRTLLITHSNQALNQLFSKIVQLDIDEHHCVRLGHGTDGLETGKDFSKQGRVDALLARRLDLLSRVRDLAVGMGLDESAADDASFSVESAGRFYLLHVAPTLASIRADPGYDGSSSAGVEPAFARFGTSQEQALSGVEDLFVALEETRPFELLRSGGDRGDHLVVTQAKIIAMTCTHAALKWPQLVEELRFKFDNVVMEESGQILEVETFIPLMLQGVDVVTGHGLKRVTLIGDHHQLPPVVKSPVLAGVGNLDQSMFARLIRLGVPAVVLDAQGRMRPSLRSLFGWRYPELGDLSHVASPGPDSAFAAESNPGFALPFQVIDVPDYQGEGERTPSSYFYQNLGEAEYVAAVYMYARLAGYRADQIAVLTSYNGQRALLRDVFAARCGENPLFGMPGSISTVDKFQGQQADIVLLSLVRTASVGHIRDVRRLVVALSRARLGLYVFCRVSLFADCYELAPAFDQLVSARPDLKLALSPPPHLASFFGGGGVVDGVAEMGAGVYDATMAALHASSAANERSE